MFIPPQPGPGWKFNPPPGWPAPPAGWEPGIGWSPEPHWPQPPQGWVWWVTEPGTSPDVFVSRTHEAGTWAPHGHNVKSGSAAKWLLVGGASLVALIALAVGVASFMTRAETPISTTKELVARIEASLGEKCSPMESYNSMMDVPGESEACIFGDNALFLVVGQRSFQVATYDNPPDRTDPMLVPVLTKDNWAIMDPDPNGFEFLQKLQGDMGGRYGLMDLSKRG